MSKSGGEKEILKAASAGDVEAIRKLINDGVSIEARDLNRKTPIMLAAEAGHEGAFKALVDHGADLHALALDQLDLLECAAAGGSAEIVRFLIDAGLPLEGHWRARSKAEERLGHITPLISAAMNGHGAVVELLLSAGANWTAAFDKQTALDFVLADLKHPANPQSDEDKRRLQAVAELLAGKASENGIDGGPDRWIAHFASAAELPAFQGLRRLISDRCGKGRPWQPIADHGYSVAGVEIFEWPNCREPAVIRDLQDKARAAESHLVLAEPWTSGEDALLVLFPTCNKLAVVAATGTEGNNHGVSGQDIITWLEELDRTNPFNLVYCSHELVGGDFLGPVKGPTKVARQMVDLCPGTFDDASTATVEAIAASLQARRSFLLRWD